MASKRDKTVKNTPQANQPKPTMPSVETSENDKKEARKIDTGEQAGKPEIPDQAATSAQNTTQQVEAADTSKDQSSGKTSAREDSIRSYVERQQFKNRKCKTYIPISSNFPDRCKCGRDAEWHRNEGMKVTYGDPKKKKWDSDKNTSRVYASFGNISFGLDPFEDSVPYIRVDSEQDQETCWTLLNKHWEMQRPKLLISVTGDANYFSIKPELKSRFERGLMKAAKTAEAWIITDGLATELVKFVGEAVRDHALTTKHKIVALGIAPWGCVKNKECLVAKNEKGNFPASYHIDGSMPNKPSGVLPLDHNHTHFLLVDDGTEGKFGMEITFRTAFEEYISKKITPEYAEDKTSKGTTNGDNQSDNQSALTLVLEGGKNAILMAQAALERGTPVVVVQGSGRAADLIAEAHRTHNEKPPDEKRFNEQFRGGVKSLLSLSKDGAQFLPSTSEEDEKKKEDPEKVVLDSLREILKKRNLVTVFSLDDLDTTLEIDQVILDAILKAKKYRLQLALDWGRVKVARQEMWTTNNKTYLEESKEIDWNTQMFEALVHDRVDTVRLCLDHGVDLNKFLTFERLQKLYAEVLNKSYGTGLLRNLLHKVEKWKDPTEFRADQKLLGAVNKVVNGWLLNRHYDLYKGEKKGTVADDRSESERKELRLRKQKSALRHPTKDLLIWAVLFNRKDLALLFWQSCESLIGSALVASNLLQSLSKRADKEGQTDLGLDLIKHSKEFEDRAIGVLNECYRLNETKAHELLVENLETWDATTVLAIAGSAKQMDFMGLAACQTKLNEIWTGRMAIYTPLWKIVLALVFPFVILIIDFNEKKRRDSKADNPESDKSSPENDKSSPEGENSSSKSTTPESKAPPLYKKCHYYYTSPVVKFWYHAISQVIFLGLFSFFVLTDLRPASEQNSPGPVEITVWAWAATVVLEEVRQLISKQIASEEGLRRWFKTRSFVRFLANLVLHSLLVTSIVLRFTTDGSTFVWARMSYCLTLFMYFLTFMPVFFVAENTGPKVMMILLMLKDMLFFLTIFLVIFLAYGVTSHALRYPNSDADWVLLTDVVYLPYWNVYGELFLDQLEGDVPGCSSNEAELKLNSNLVRCPEKSRLALTLFAIYMVLTNVILLNLLIAVFSNTFEKVQENSKKVWRFYSYGLIREYVGRPAIAPPLIICIHILRTIKYIQLQRHNAELDEEFRERFSRTENRKLGVFERQAMETHLLDIHMNSQQQVETKVDSARKRIGMVIGDLEVIKKHLNLGSPAQKTAETKTTSSNSNPKKTSTTPR